MCYFYSANYKLHMKTLEKNTWKSHPWNIGRSVESLSVKFLLSISNPNRVNYTNDLEGNIKPERAVFADIEKNGMRDPLLIVVSRKHKTVRLEAGNHRVNVADKLSYTHLPCATLVIDDLFIHEGNGTHHYPADNLLNFDMLHPSPYPYHIKWSNIAKDTKARLIIFDNE